MVYFGILAGGENIIVKDNLPIQFTMLGSKPLIVHTIEQFIINSHLKKIIVVVPSKYLGYSEDLLSKYFDLTDIEIICGGKNKNTSINKMVDYIENNYGINEDDVLLCHDAIRPFITQKVINENISLSKTYDAINTVVPSIETVICSNNGQTVDKIPRTTTVFIEQTPQTFRIKSIKELSKKVNSSLSEKEIDLARLFVSMGQEVRILKGEFSNIKIVTEYDLELASVLIKERG